MVKYILETLDKQFKYFSKIMIKLHIYVEVC